MSFPTDPYMEAKIANQNVSKSAWTCLNPQELLSFAPQRRENVVLSGQNGVLARKTFDDEQTIDLQFILTGNHVPAGDTYDNAAERLAALKRTFATTYFRATRDSNGCVTCTVKDIDGTNYSGPVQVGPPVFGEGLYECTAVMSVTIPRGELQKVTP